LDGATWKLLRKWVQDGSLPNLARLYANGARGTLISTVPSATCPALPSLFTGKNPGNLGIFSFLKANGAPFRFDDISDMRIWNVLDHHGKSSCVVDVRITYPPEPLNGVMVSGTPIPKEKHIACYPADLEERLGRRIETISIFRKHVNKQHGGRGDVLQIADETLGDLRDYTEERYSVLSHLTSEREYDFIFTWYGDVDSIQHIAWNRPEVILRHFERIDDQIGRFLRDFEGSNIIIMSDHGFQKNYHLRFMVNMWLRQEGFLEFSGNPLIWWLFNTGTRMLRRLISKRTLQKFRRRQQAARSDKVSDDVVLVDSYRNIPGINWRRTKAYFRNTWGIQIVKENLTEDYEVFRERLLQVMRAYTAPSGIRPFARVWKKEEVYAGKYLSQLPDIVYQLHEDCSADPMRVSGSVIQSKMRFFKGERAVYWTGNHLYDREGIFLGFGPGFAKGCDIQPAHIEDIAPTVYHLLGCAIPNDLDGRVITEALSERLRSQEPEYFTPRPSHKSEKEIRATDEEESIKQQLRDMGYLQD
jgi:predicted AlkP superfamily phosphohydrolase/phosphomutase